MCSVRFIQWFLTKIIKEKTGDLKFRSEWTVFRFTQGPVSSGFTVQSNGAQQTNIKRGGPHVCTCPQPGHGCPMPYAVVFFSII